MFAAYVLGVLFSLIFLGSLGQAGQETCHPNFRRACCTERYSSSAGESDLAVLHFRLPHDCRVSTIVQFQRSDPRPLPHGGCGGIEPLRSKVCNSMKELSRSRRSKQPLTKSVGDHIVDCLVLRDKVVAVGSRPTSTTAPKAPSETTTTRRG